MWQVYLASILELNGSERYSCCNLHAVISPLFAYLQAILGTSDMLCTCERVATGEVREGSATNMWRGRLEMTGITVGWQVDAYTILYINPEPH